MLEEIIAQTSEAMEAVFQAEAIRHLARETGVVKRISKMDGLHLLRTLAFGFIEHPQASLGDLCEISEDLGVPISRQGVDERLTEAMVVFLQACLTRMLQTLQAKRGLVPAVLAQFPEVYLQDSTIQSLPESLQEQFPGSGGKASPASLKIQLLFGLLSGNLTHLCLQAGNTPDTQYCEHVGYVQAGSLLIQDLGFFNLPALQAVADRHAFFLSRWRQDVLVYLNEQADSPLDLLPFLTQQNQPMAEYSVQVGKSARLACRMVVVRLPQAVAEKRRRRLREDAQRRGDTPSERALALCAWNIFLTNLPPERLSLRQLLACYGLRWQVELIFKLWKSQAGLKFLAGKRKERVLCEVYARLIGLSLTHFLLAPLRFWYIDQQIEISLPKAHDILQHASAKLFPLIGHDLPALTTQLKCLFHRILRRGRKTRRGHTLSSLQRLALADQCDLAALFPLA